MDRLTKRNGKYIEYSDENYNGSIDNRTMLEKCLSKLAEYEDLEEQGLLLRLPCKVGTPVYMVAEDCGGDTLDCRRGGCEGCSYLYSFVEENSFDTYMVDDIGKTVFLTKAEAEQALKKEVLIENAKDNLAEEIASLGLTDKADARDRIECLLKQIGE